MPTAYVSLGSNIERDKNIRKGLAALTEQFGQLKLSSVYEADPVGFSGKPFYNLVVSFTSSLAVKQLCQTLRQIELACGRPKKAEKFSARTLDLDLLLYDNLIICETDFHIPRIEITRYAFVLEPLAELVPDLIHPVLQVSYQTLWEKFDKNNLKQHKIVF